MHRFHAWSALCATKRCLRIAVPCASYIPPASEDRIYSAHVDNIIALQSEISAHQLCVLGDFNLSNISWTYLHNNMYLTPSNISSNTESYLVDNLLSIDLTQVNGFSNSLNRILDLIFVSNNIKFKLYFPGTAISPPNMHHFPLILEIEFLNTFAFLEICKGFPLTMALVTLTFLTIPSPLLIGMMFWVRRCCFLF